MDTIPLRDAFRTLLDAAATLADAGDSGAIAPTGEWNADQILAHVSLVNAATIAAVSTVTAGAHTTYDNRIALDTWTIDSVITRAGGHAGLRERIRVQADTLCALGGPTLSETELDTAVPCRLLSNDAVLVDQPDVTAAHHHRPGRGRAARPHRATAGPVALRPAKLLVAPP